MSDLSDMARGLGAQALAEARVILGDAWDDLSTQDKARIQEAADDLADLTFLAIGGMPVEREVLHCRATIANWTFIHAERTRSALADAFARALAWGGQAAMRVFVGI